MSERDHVTGAGLSPMAAALVPRELLSWSLTSVGMAALEGGLLGVIVKNQFAGVASPLAVNFAVAIVAGAPAFANLSSLLFSTWSVGKDKLLLVSRLMQVIAVCLLLMALPGRSLTGLVIFTIMTIIARSAWSGIMTIRAAIWRSNYRRQWRGQVTARIVRVGATMMVLAGALTGWLLDWQENAYRMIFPVMAASMIAASLVYRRGRVRRHGQLLREERNSQLQAGWKSGLFGAFRSVLKEDQQFRKYMIGMMILGFGNLMTIPLLVVLINEQFSISQLQQVLITSSIPLAVLVLIIPIWARFLDGRHIFAFRAFHSWFFTSASAIFACAIILGLAPLLWFGAVLMGSAWAGGHLGWNLGHNDFSDDARSTQYMAVHVTLTGVRGLLAPVLGIAFYQYLYSLNPHHAMYAILLPPLLSACGSVYFVLHQRNIKRLAQS